MSGKMRQIRISRDDYDRVNELALLPMADASFEDDPRHGPVTLTFESKAYFDEAVETFAEHKVRYTALEEGDNDTHVD